MEKIRQPDAIGKASDWEIPKQGSFGNSPWSLYSLIKEFDLKADYCATTQYLPIWYGPDDSLKVEWTWNGFLNPPHRRQDLWIRYAVEQVRCHGITLVCLLRVDTSAQYFQECVMEVNADGTPHRIEGVSVERRWICGRVGFYPNGLTADFASIIVIYRPRSGVLDGLRNIEEC